MQKKQQFYKPTVYRTGNLLTDDLENYSDTDYEQVVRKKKEKKPTYRDTDYGAEIFGFFLLSYPQNERNVYQFYSVSFAQFVYFLSEVCLLFNF